MKNNLTFKKNLICLIISYVLAILIIMLLFSGCKKKNIEYHPCVDNTCITKFWVDGGTIDKNGYIHIKWVGQGYFTVIGELTKLNEQYVINGIPLIETLFDSNYWVLFDTIKYITPMYSPLGWYSSGDFNDPISIGTNTYTLKNIAHLHPPMNIAGYQINPYTCFDCPYSSTLFGVYSKYNYNPKTHMFLHKQMVGDTAGIYIKTTYNSDIGRREEKFINLNVIFE